MLRTFATTLLQAVLIISLYAREKFMFGLADRDCEAPGLQ